MPKVLRKKKKAAQKKPFWSDECRKAFDPAEYEFGASLAFYFVSGAIVASTSALDSESVNLSRTLVVALSEGFMYSTLVQAAQEISFGRSGYLNPAVSLAMFLLHAAYTKSKLRYWQLVRMGLLFAAQISAALLATFLIYCLVPGTSRGLEIPGIGTLDADQTPEAGFVLETIVSMFLVYVLLCTRINEERKCSWMIAFVVVVCKLVTFPLTGGCMNPARYLGAIPFAPSGHSLDAFWMYLFSPMVGAVLGTGLFVLFRGADIAAVNK